MVFLALIAERRVFGGRGAGMDATLEDVTKKKPELAAQDLVRQPGTVPVADRSGRAARAADQDGAGDRPWTRS